MKRFISCYFISLIFILIFSLCFFIPVFSNYGSISTYNTNSNSQYLNISSSGLLWPTPRF